MNCLRATSGLRGLSARQSLGGLILRSKDSSIRATVATIQASSGSNYKNNHDHQHLLLSSSVALALALACGSTVALCDEGAPVSKNAAAATTATITPRPTRPLWPDGVSEKDVEALVMDILGDPTLRISFVPDSIVRHVYKSTIWLTLNLFYSLFASLNGVDLLAHELRLYRHVDTQSAPTDSAQKSKMINEEVLEQVADRLLANEVVNSGLVPDAIERQIYINCLKVIFRVLTVIANSLRVNTCGHQFRIVLEPFETQAAVEHAFQVSSSLSKIDVDRLRQFALKAGIQEQEQNELSWWDSLFFKRELVAQLHASLYGLLLGIVDDLLANTKIQILSDEIGIDIVPASQDKLDAIQKDITALNEASSMDQSGSVGSFALASFAAGVGMGVTVMAVLTNKR
jgi:hypothetical protein